VIDKKKKAILDEISSFLEVPRQEDDEITTMEYAEFNRCTHRRAYTQLMKAVTDNRMTKRKVLANRNWVWAFRRVEDEEASNSSGRCSATV